MSSTPTVWEAGAPFPEGRWNGCWYLNDDPTAGGRMEPTIPSKASGVLRPDVIIQWILPGPTWILTAGDHLAEQSTAERWETQLHGRAQLRDERGVAPSFHPLFTLVPWLRVVACGCFCVGDRLCLVLDRQQRKQILDYDFTLEGFALPPSHVLSICLFALLQIMWGGGHSVSFHFCFADWTAHRPEPTQAASRKKNQFFVVDNAKFQTDIFFGVWWLRMFFWESCWRKGPRMALTASVSVRMVDVEVTIFPMASSFAGPTNMTSNRSLEMLIATGVFFWIPDVRTHELGCFSVSLLTGLL